MSIRALLLACVLAACSDPTGGDDGGRPDAVVTPDGGGVPDGDIVPDADPCGAGAVCDCIVDGDCGAHEYCNTAGPGRTCDCAPAYARIGGNDCLWGGAPNDPGFQSVAVWSPTGGVALAPAASGSADPGEAAWSAFAVCDLDSVRQTFTMPTWAQAEPLVVKLTHRGTSGGMFGSPPTPAFAVGGAWVLSGGYFAGGTWRESVWCLGEAGYGGAREFVASVAERPWD